MKINAKKFEKIIKIFCEYKKLFYLCIRVEQVLVLSHRPIGY